VAGDKVYGPDAGYFLEFCEHGWTPELASQLGFHRQALHAFRMIFDLGDQHWVFTAPLADELVALTTRDLQIPGEELAGDALVRLTADLRNHYCLGGGGNRSLA